MPFVNIKITRDHASRAQKAELIRDISESLFRVLGKTPDMTVVLIEEHDAEFWGVGGQLLSDRKSGGK